MVVEEEEEDDGGSDVVVDPLYSPVERVSNARKQLQYQAN